MKILVMGLPGSGKSTLAEKLTIEICKNMPAQHINADVIREEYNDWDFTMEGRIRQAERMRDLSIKSIEMGVIPICDFVCPTQETRKIMSADLTVWMDTITQSDYKDTNQIFQPPSADEYSIRVYSFDSDKWANTLADLVHILN
jgi:adenylylsulfate kinase